VYNPNLGLLCRTLSDRLPQEWQVDTSEQTTCKGTITILRVNQFKIDPTTGDRLVCFIQLKDKEIVIYSRDILSWEIQIVVKRIKTAIYLKLITEHSITITECLLVCESCHEAINFHEKLFVPYYEEILISP
jgi:hypothetical protein